MDSPKDGTENQGHTITAKSRPAPPVAKKPKPSLPKKPAVAVKPGNLPLAQTHNGADGDKSISQPCTKPILPHQLLSTEASSASTSPRGITPRPKEPPPPLPKTPPKGPSVTKTPPPLPKSPPKGGPGVKPQPRKKNLLAQSSVESSAFPPISDDETETCSSPANANQTVPSSYLNSTNQSTCDISETALPANTRTDDVVKDTEDFAFANLKSKFTGSSDDIASKLIPKVPVKPQPRHFNKDKHINEIVNQTEDLKKSSEQKPGIKETKVENCGNCTWFVPEEGRPVSETESPGAEVPKIPFTSTTSQIQFKLEKQESIGDSSVRFRKCHSPAPSPPVPRKPLPKIPAQSQSQLEDKTSTVNKISHAASESNTHSPVQSPKVPRKPPPKITAKKSQVITTSHSEDKPKIEISNYSCDKSNSSVNEAGDSPHEQLSSTFHEIVNAEQSKSETKVGTETPTCPKPIPRKPIPAVRPRPTPRKRLSLNRSSVTEELLDNQLIHNLECDSEEGTKFPLSKSKSEESVSGAPQELKLVQKDLNIDLDSINDSKSDNTIVTTVGRGIPDSKSDTGIKALDNYANKFDNKNQGGSKVKSVVKSRVVYTDKGEEKQYRVIDKTIVKPLSHITDVDANTNDDTTVLLRKKKDTTSENLESDQTEMPTIAELRDLLKGKKKASSPKVAQKYVPNTEDEFANDVVSKSSASGEINDSAKAEESGVVSDVNSESKGSFEDLLLDKSILEPTSLLNEIEEILSRSYKHSSLSRSGSSPEKKQSPFLERLDVKHERSKSVDTYSETTPVRPPRPKKEQKRLRSRSQLLYDSCGSDTESLPDISRTSNELKGDLSNSLSLGPAKPHPPKPKRNKLLKVQRSQSDVTAMKSIVDKLEKEQSASSQHKRQNSDSGSAGMNVDTNTPEGRGISAQRPTSWRKSRPARKAPPPPSVSPYKVTLPSPAVNINKVVPLDNRVKSLNLDHGHPTKDKGKVKSGKRGVATKDTDGSFYHSIHDDDIYDSSDGDHDYHEISDEMEKGSPISKCSFGNMTKPSVSSDHKEKSRSPPKLPPRNLNGSQSLETSSLSSLGHDIDSAVTGGTSSVDDLSLSSGCLDPEVEIRISSDLPQFQSHYPKTSSPNVKRTEMDENENIGHGQSTLSLSDSTEDKTDGRPVSGVSFQSDSGSGHLSSSDMEGDDEDKITEKKKKKLFMIAQEIASSERVFVDVLRLLNVDFRKHISNATEHAGRPVIPCDTLNRILDYLPQLQNFNEDLLKDLDERISKWDGQQGVADIFVKKGPFLKLYSSYIRDFETMTSTLDDAVKKYPAFQTACKEFEMSSRCSSLALKHYMLKPIQRIPQYKLLLQDYTKHLPPDSPELKDMHTALAIVSEVAHHANESMRHEDYVQKMLEIQRSLIGQFEVIKPGRVFLKEGELMKLSRKEMQPRFFFLFNDVLLYTTPVATGYRLNNVLPLAGMKVSVSSQDEYKTEFSVISVQRSFTLNGGTVEEREDWVTALNAAIEENALKRNTFEAVRVGNQVLLDKDFVLGHKAPLWIPDARVTMCMLCTCEFTVTWRRHHCRACGRVVCGTCSECKAPLRYLKYKPARVCVECFKTLEQNVDKEVPDGGTTDKGENNSAVKDEEEGMSLLSLNGLFERFNKIRTSKGKGSRNEKKWQVTRPDRLKEVPATDPGASMSGYLHRFHKKKWKKQWYLIKEKVLYTFKATQDTAAGESMALLGYEVSRFTEYFEGTEPDLLFQLSHPNTDPCVFRTDSATATERWVTVMRESTVA